jgi:hypothetical protein
MYSLPIQNSGETVAGRIENLKPWPKGRSGNPGGRPTAKPITELYEQLLNDAATIKVIRAAIIKTIKGKTAVVPLLREMADRLEGKVTQPVVANVTPMSTLTDEELQAKIDRIMEALRAAEPLGKQTGIDAIVEGKRTEATGSDS